MRTSQFTPSVFLMVGLAIAGEAAATTTTATASAFVNGFTVSQADTGDATGAQASAAQTIPSAVGAIFVSAQASSAPGSLAAAGDASTGGGGSIQARAIAEWSDAFVISASGYDSSMTGTLSGSVLVTGDLLVEYIGRTHADTQVYGHLQVSPHTGFNDGLALADGSARRLVGYDIGGIQSGTEDFTLSFVDVPFTFGRNIDVYMSLIISAEVNAFDSSSGGQSVAQYGQTMTWGGLSEVRDSAGHLLTGYSAVSAGSGFNFANPTPDPGGPSVPEPSSSLLVLVGLLPAAWLSRKAVRREGGLGNGDFAVFP